MRPPRNDRQRQPRRHSFDDEFYGNAPSPIPLPSFAPPSSSAPGLSATVKWFKPDKGFGFVALADGSGDVFLHISALQAAGFQAVAAGQTLVVRVGNGQKGRQVDQVLSVEDGPPVEAPRAAPMSRGHGAPRHQLDISAAVEMIGTVKWYNADKGFGFVTPQGGGKDVFVHATALERAGLGPLQDGQAVRVGVVQGAKGAEVGTISLI